LTARTLDEALGWEPPNPSAEGFVRFCFPLEPDPEERYREADALGHPVGAIGPSGALYIARVQRYANNRFFECSSGTVRPSNYELEVFRSRDGGDTWERIYSARAPNRELAGMRAENRPVEDGVEEGVRPALVVTCMGQGDEVLLATEQLTVGPGGAVPDRQHVRITRIRSADTCLTSSEYRETENCTFLPGDCCRNVSHSFPHESLALELGQTRFAAADIPNHYAWQPTLFTGDSVSDDGVDSRVGLFYYWQPYYSDPGVPLGRQPTTLVVGLTSDDGGQSWRIPRLPTVLANPTNTPRARGESVGHELTIPVPGRGSVYSDPLGAAALRVGEVFEPCTAPSDGYFGHYNGGAFQLEEPTNRTAVAAWADSREAACMPSANRWDTSPQHVFTSRYPLIDFGP